MRILLPKGKQNLILRQILSEISVYDAAKLCNVSERTIRDWRREKFLIQKNALKKLCQKTDVSFPVKFEEKDDYWYVAHGSSAGALACIKKYGCVGGPKRKEKWHEWWNKKGKFLQNNFFKRKIIRIPPRNKNLAEFIGIMLGDGHIPIVGSQIHITLNSRDDKDYIKFVCSLIKKLFKRDPCIFERKKENALRLHFSSIDLLKYLLQLGLKRGNKVKLQVDVPEWIKKDLEFSKMCARGLIDTDGCIFTERHKIKGKFYNYKRLNFSNRSFALLKSVYKLFQELDLNPKIRNNRCVQIEDKKNIEKYFKIIGTHNPKHLKRYKN